LQKKKQAKKAGKESRRRDAADGQDRSQKEEHAEEQKHTERTETKEEEERQKEETDFMRAWREPIYLLENVKGKVGPMRPWMQGIRESKYDFSTLEEDEYWQGTLMTPMQAPKKMLNVGASEFVPSLGGFTETDLAALF
jgi:hypothetical protein